MEKQSVEKELVELRERLQKVEEWKARRDEIDVELGKVWVADDEGKGEGELAPPPYQQEAQAS